MSRGRVTIGSRDMQRAVQRYGDSVLDEVKRIVVETAQVIQSEAKARAPVDDGTLRDSIEMEIFDGGLRARVSVGVDYAVWIEWGTGIYATQGNGRQGGWTYYSEKLGRFVFTRGNRAQPFWFESVDAGERYFAREMRNLG